MEGLLEWLGLVSRVCRIADDKGRESLGFSLFVASLK